MMRGNRIRMALPLVLDILTPMVSYWVLHGMFGLGEAVALTIGGLLVGLHALADGIRNRRWNIFTVLVLLMVTLSIAMVFLTGDARFVLAKPAVFSAIAGVYCLVSCVIGRPLGYETGKSFGVGGDPRRLTAWEESWQHSATFRRGLILLTAVWGVGLLIESAARIALVYLLPVDQAVVAAQLPGLIGLVLLIIGTRRLVPRLREPMRQRLKPTA